MAHVTNVTDLPERLEVKNNGSGFYYLNKRNII